MVKIAVIGVGHMGTAMIKGLMKNPLNKIIAENPVNPRVTKLAEKLNFTLVNSIDDLIDSKPEIIILTTPVSVTSQIARQLAKVDKDTTIISAAAGVDCETLKKILSQQTVARIIPNIPVSINAGTVGLYLPDDIDPKSKDKILNLLQQLGDVITVKEDKLSIVGTVGGCGPAFVDIFLDALGDAGVLNGLSRDVANKLAASMVKGAASLANETELVPSLLRDQVCSPGGTTIKGVASLEKNGFRNAVIEAINDANQN